MKGQKGLLQVMGYDGSKKGGINAEIYENQVLKPVLLPFWTAMQSERGDVSFQKDGASAHAAKQIKNWLTDHDIFIFPDPPSSPDVNTIELVWHKLYH